MTQLLNAVMEGRAHDLSQILAQEISIADLQVCDIQGNNLFEIMIANQDFLTLSALIKGLQAKKDKSWHQLLLKHPLPILKAAALKDPQFFDLLIKQTVGYTPADLQLIKKTRATTLLSERRWGKFGAFLRSLCPSKSLADFFNISETLAGFGFVLGSGVLTLTGIPAAILVFVGLTVIAYSNYQRLIVEQDIEEDRLNKTLLQAKLNNLENRAAQLTAAELAQELTELSLETTQLKPINYYDKKNNPDFLRPKDKFFAIIIALGELLCSSSGLLAFSVLLLTASAFAWSLPLMMAFGSLAMVSITAICYTHSPQNKKIIALAGLAALGITLFAASLGFPLLVFALTGLTITGMGIFYVQNHSKQNKEFIEQRRGQSDLDLKLYKTCKDFKYKIARFLPNASDLLTPKSAKEVALKHALKGSFDSAWEGLGGNPEQHFEPTIGTGNTRWLKFLISHGLSVPMQNALGKTPLHLAVEQGQLLMVETMLGVSFCAKNRKASIGIPNPYQEATKSYDEFEALKEKRKIMVGHYERLYAQTQEMVLLHDKQGHLPLYYAAQLTDPTLYNRLLEQPVVYPKEDLDEALKQRLKHIQKEKWQALGLAIIESICPGNALPEIVFSIAFIGLVVSTPVLNFVLGLVSIPIFGLVCWSNYYKNKQEKGIHSEIEQLAVYIAQLNGIKLQLKNLKQPTIQAEAEIQAAIQQIDNLPLIVANKPEQTKAPALITTTDKLRVLFTALGAFLCTFAGALAVLEVFTDATFLMTTGSVLALSGPMSLAFMGIGLAIGFGAAFYCFFNRHHDLRLAAEVKQLNYFKQEAVLALFELPLIKELAKQPQISPLSRLQDHVEHPNCINANKNRTLEEVKTETPVVKNDISPALCTAIIANAVKK